MIRLVALLVPLAIVASWGCAARRHAAPASERPAALAPEDVDRLFSERLNAGDTDGLVALYEPTATLIRQDRTAAVGTAAIREELAGAVALRPEITLNVFRVLKAGDDLAVLYDDWHATGTDRTGKRIELSGRASEVVRRQADGTWRFVVDDPDARAATCPTHAARDHGTPHKAHRTRPAARH